MEVEIVNTGRKRDVFNTLRNAGGDAPETEPNEKLYSMFDFSMVLGASRMLTEYSIRDELIKHAAVSLFFFFFAVCLFDSSAAEGTPACRNGPLRVFNGPFAAWQRQGPVVRSVSPPQHFLGAVADEEVISFSISMKK